MGVVVIWSRAPHLTSHTNTNTNTKQQQAAHRLVARWTKSIDLFTKKMIFVPINEALHWYAPRPFHPPRTHRPPFNPP